MRATVPIESVAVSAFEIPTDRPEADGTISWTSTTMVLVEVFARGKIGIGYTYAHACIARLISDTLAPLVEGSDALCPEQSWAAMQRAIRNLGRQGLAATAISAVDTALYDLKARLLDLPLCALLGSFREEVPIYGSGGFTSYSDEELRRQLAGWVSEQRCAYVKMKVGSDPARDPHRVEVARLAIGDRAALFVDANGAYTAKQALGLAQPFSDLGVSWFEEPVSSDDLPGLRLVREHLHAGIDVAAGEYSYTTDQVRMMLQAGAVDVQQADITRCGGVTGFQQIAALCDAFHTDLSGHCAPSLHLHAACAAPRLRHLEWFHDHVRIEHMLFDGAPQPKDGKIRPDLARPGHGLIFKHADAARYAVSAT
ncbi:putative Mandelate racemase/muconate lactonizing enzyme family protein [Bradyrhizobium sp. ORS 285]|uniref:enolase C-terminal domain-like protein n=1 Tax=Bradyrhizobium sp. ORS 285 TaxID=115808 RepID=UPI000240840C|nr:enolase C-terminal domain-like protein [Bradyrhizobium sp. ORS 285]CCD86224.1 putative Mandelate racemase/muconate lactonizing enzyme family protein [Bradyrhizobium sp. ORS 285]SMX61009.1 putative Mandelate racemase/muconate lactonizing enzyme family protein [Bradyrhizobium sp. ORS 285]